MSQNPERCGFGCEWSGAEDRNAAVVSGIGGLQSAANFGDEMGRQRDNCLITRSEKRRLQVLYAKARQNQSVAA
jgi:hypothetical protein